MDGMAEVSTRLNRVQGQVRGLQRMVCEEAPCAEILTQVAATRGALRAVARQLYSPGICVSSSIRPMPAAASSTRARWLTSNRPSPG
jgi:DNA-binding FrmR family transcriptional regulator